MSKAPMTAQTMATIRVVRLRPECCGAAEGEADVAAAGVGEVEDGEVEEAWVSFAAAELMSAAAAVTETMKSLRGLAFVVACAIAPAMPARSSATERRGFCCMLQRCDGDIAR